MLVELHTKGGNLCLHAKEGKIHCPLIVRPTSEDVVTGQIVQSLSLINPRHWVSDLLNEALGMRQFSRQIYRKFRIEPWVGKPPFPRELLKWDEGSTEVDVQITWENPPTTIFIEAKYGSKLSAGTANNNGQHGFPSDQLVRNIRVGLHECGYYRTNALFETQRRNFAVSGEPVRITWPRSSRSPTSASRLANQRSDWTGPASAAASSVTPATLSLMRTTAPSHLRPFARPHWGARIPRAVPRSRQATHREAR